MINYFLHMLIIILIQLLLALSVQLSIGFSGMMSFAHIAFYGIGAYTSALLTMNGVPFVFAILLGGLIPALFSLILIIPTSKLKGEYLSLMTIGFTFIVYAVLINWTGLTRGPLGIPGIVKPNILGFSFNTLPLFLLLTTIIFGIIHFVLEYFVKTPFGKLIEACRDDEVACESLGKSVFKIKAVTSLVVGFVAGVAGVLYAHYITYIDPSSFTMMQIIPIISIVFVGGLANFKGTVVACTILTIIPEILRFVGMPSSILGPMRQIIYALILIVILIYLPKGFMGKVELED